MTKRKLLLHGLEIIDTTIKLIQRQKSIVWRKISTAQKSAVRKMSTAQKSIVRKTSTTQSKFYGQQVRCKN